MNVHEINSQKLVFFLCFKILQFLSWKVCIKYMKYWTLLKSPEFPRYIEKIHWISRVSQVLYEPWKIHINIANNAYNENFNNSVKSYYLCMLYNGQINGKNNAELNQTRD